MGVRRIVACPKADGRVRIEKTAVVIAEAILNLIQYPLDGKCPGHPGCPKDGWDVLSEILIKF
jgi:hypothetical protein